MTNREERLIKEIDQYIEEIDSVTEKQDGSHAMDIPAAFFGGRLDGCFLNHKVLHHLKIVGYMPRWSAMKGELHKNHLNIPEMEDQPIIEGYRAPLFEDGILKYTTEEYWDKAIEQIGGKKDEREKE